MSIRDDLVNVALAWQDRYGVAPAITSAVSEFDAATLVGMTDHEYCTSCAGATAVRKGYDFVWKGKRFQVKANRPSGRPGSFVTLVAKASNYDWDHLIWILYDRAYVIQEAWTWSMSDYRDRFDALTRLSPAHMRQGFRLR